MGNNRRGIVCRNRNYWSKWTKFCIRNVGIIVFCILDNNIFQMDYKHYQKTPGTDVG